MFKTKNLYVGKLNSTYQGEDDQLYCKDGTINYIFEFRKNKYYELFSKQLIETEDSCHKDDFLSSNINQLYLSDIKPIKELIPDIKDKVPEECLLYMFDKIN